MKRAVLLAAALVVTVGVSAQASIISGVSATSSIGTYFTYRIAHLTDGSGLSTPISLTSTHDNSYANMWMSDTGGTTGTLVFDLGKVYELSGMAIWQYNSTGSSTYMRGVKTYSLDYSADGSNYAQLQAAAQLPSAAGVAALAPMQVTVPASTSARYVRMNISANWGDSNYVGLSEIQFNAVNAPEPTAIAGLLAASSGLLIRRRQKKA